MNLRTLLFIAALIGASGPGGATTSGTPPPEVRPQWLQQFSREVFATDAIRSPNGLTWTRLANGDIVLVTVIYVPDSGTALLARRFAADGELLLTRVLPSSQTGTADYAKTIIRTDPVSGDVVVLSGADAPAPSSQCALLRLDATLHVSVSTPIGSETSSSNACVALNLLPDGSAIVADVAGLSRVASDGSVTWSVRSSDDGRYLHPRDVLIDDSNAIWIASNGGTYPDHSEQAAVLRFDLDGERLSEDYFVCHTCTSSAADSLLLLADGRVMVGGSSFISTQPGFVARYAASGQQELLVDTQPDITYAPLMQDDDGSLFAFADSVVQNADEVRRIDPADGAVLWSVPADNIAAAPHGIVVVRDTPKDILATGIDAGGAETWTRVLVPGGSGAVSRGQRVGDRSELLVRMYEGEPDCGSAPQLVALDGDGQIDILARPCVMPASTYIGSVDALAGVGVLAGVANRLVAYTPDGDFRWDAFTCLWCAGRDWLVVKLTPDGGAWGIDFDYFDGLTALVRLDNGGQTVVSQPIDLLAQSYVPFGFLGDDDSAVLVQGSSQTLTWQRVQTATGALETQSHTWSAPPFYITAARQVPDGGVAVALVDQPCDIMCPPQYYLAIVRLTSDGMVDWIYEAPEGIGVAALDEQGGANLVVPGDNQTLRLRHVQPDGSVDPDILLAGISESLASLHGPYQGRLLLATDDYAPTFSLWSIDAAGQVLATRTLEGGTRIKDASSLGLLVARESNQASATEWIDPVTLQTRAYFRIAADGTDVFDYFNSWRLLPDGSVYGTDTVAAAAGFSTPRLARFTAPGFPATELIYRNGFD